MRPSAVAVILSGIFPGLGQLYNRQWLKAAAFLVAGAWLSWISARALPSDLEALASAPVSREALAEIGVLLVVWTWSIVDAWRHASRARPA